MVVWRISGRLTSVCHFVCEKNFLCEWMLLGFVLEEKRKIGKPQVPTMVDAVATGDKLILRGLKFHGFHGVKPEERKLGQKFLVDVDAWLDLQPAGTSDNLSDTISYTDIYRLVKDVVEGEPKNLLESVAELIASGTLTKFSPISAVRVKVGKPHVAVHGTVDYLGVEILRYRKIKDVSG